MFRSNHPDDRGKILSLLWLFAILNMLFRDIHEMTMAATINEILSGYVNGNPMSESVLFFGAFAVELLLLVFLLSGLLAPYWARLLNLVMVPVAILGTFYIAPNDPDDYFFAVVEICAFITIFVMAWRWQTAPRATRQIGGHHAT
ncbi:DUF6326 family protein [Yoonia sp. SS1-5]|uniref:DUF6326 family protein n=1 Tax=Yoonia rhodophyticola TaxID=3137370 RepID=A0AAN0M9R6_9RHOB